MSSTTTPSLYEWLGGMDALLRLTTRFYERVPDSPVLKPIFEHMGPEHPAHVATFLAEVLGGQAEWLAVINSQPGVAVDLDAPMPKWGWGEVKGQYIAKPS